MAIRTPEIPTQFGALDSVAYADGDVPTAHVLREIGRSANRLMVRSEPIFSWAWDAGGAVAEVPVGGFGGYGLPIWCQIRPTMTHPKPIGLRRAKLNVRTYARLNEELLLQVVTRAASFNPSADRNSNNCLRITGTGALAWFSKADIPISGEAWEEISVYLFCEPTTNVPTGGGATNGTIETPAGPYAIIDDLGGWTTDSGGASYAEAGCAIIFEDSAGTRIGQPSWITSVQTATLLHFAPAFINQFAVQSLVGANYRIRELARWRFVNIALHAQDRTG